MSVIPGSVRFTGFIAPTDDTDTYAVTDPVWGKGALRTVADTTERDAITAARREEGMLVYTVSNAHYYKLQSDLTSWTDFGTSLGGGSGTDSNLISGLTCDSSVTVGSAVYLDGSGVVFRAQADAVSTSSVFGFCETKDSSTVANVRVAGLCLASFSSLTEGAQYFLDEANPGEISTVAPSGSSAVVVGVGYALSATQMIIQITKRTVRAA